MDYFTSNYIEGQYPIGLWNHYETKDEPRTNNNVEGYNLKLKKHSGCSHLDIYKSI